MANILLGVTGSVAAIRTPALYQRLRQSGHHVKMVATQAALYFFDPLEIAAFDGRRNADVVILDADEWPGRSEGRRWQRDDPVLHIELRRWADLLLIAPLDANTLAKLAHGLCDNCLTCVWRAWDTERPIVLAPAMNTLMWEHPLTAQQLLQVALCSLEGQTVPDRPTDGSNEEIIGWINRTCPQLRIVPPQSKRLACGDVGVGGLAELDDIIAAVQGLFTG
jgi:phosphopantothenoylcysteine decarboxylase